MVLQKNILYLGSYTETLQSKLFFELNSTALTMSLVVLVIWVNTWWCSGAISSRVLGEQAILVSNMRLQQAKHMFQSGELSLSPPAT